MKFPRFVGGLSPPVGLADPPLNGLAHFEVLDYCIAFALLCQLSFSFFKSFLTPLHPFFKAQF